MRSFNSKGLKALLPSSPNSAAIILHLWNIILKSNTRNEIMSFFVVKKIRSSNLMGNKTKLCPLPRSTTEKDVAPASLSRHAHYLFHFSHLLWMRGSPHYCLEVHGVPHGFSFRTLIFPRQNSNLHSLGTTHALPLCLPLTHHPPPTDERNRPSSTTQASAAWWRQRAWRRWFNGEDGP